MVRKSKGFRVKTRHKLRQSPSARPPITKFLQEFGMGQGVAIEHQGVAIEHEPSSHKGMPYPKFKGAIGKIVSRRGNSYVVEIKVGNSRKMIISRPEHLKAI
ncbi:MAG: 50S ribosomal protein L21e [Candidatus Aenigmarchaeota archaeon]|nr:50S ribosomal protein L21e [Candidatus Aenigmarchaeota archaeon]